jgi:primosomal protein N' (replication factor Y)
MADAYARVVFPISLKQTFTYKVPSALGPLAVPGSRVFASFGRRQAVGLISSLEGRPFKEGLRLKAIDAVLDSEPALTPDLLELGRWMADYYYASLGETYFAMIPSGLSKNPRSVLETTPEATDEKLDEILGRFKLRGVNLGSLRSGRIPYTTRTRGFAEALREAGLGQVSLRNELDEVSPPDEDSFLGKPGPEPNEDQAKALVQIEEAIDKGGYTPFLLEGVTGSGKTEVYLRAIRRTLEKGRQALVLIPEIALTPQTVFRFKERLGSKVAVLHSRLTPVQRALEWRKIARGDADVVVGARSALFAPTKRLGLIVVDEEHEPSYKQEDSPRYQARDAALVRARLAGAVAILGSATPSLETIHNAWTGKYRHLKLPRRARGTKPEVRIVDLREEWRSRGGDRPVLSLPLREAMEKTLSAGGQAMLFLNRRGFHTITLCSKCGEPVHCPSCDVPLTFHREYGPTHGFAWACHYCMRVFPSPPPCKACGCKESDQAGLGTERLESETRNLFPNARLGRMDFDTTRRAGALESILKKFGKGEVDVLVGTQMIAKGHDFPGVTLVGVVGADVGLALPDFRSAERVFQLLVQVSGRAGRGEQPGTVYFQTFHPDHPCVVGAALGGRSGLCEGRTRIA